MNHQVTVYNLSHPDIQPIRARLCANFWSKFCGLMLQPAIAQDEGILIDEGKDSIAATSIHMFFMRFDIAAIWITSQFFVVDTKIAKTWHPMYTASQPARYILEAHPDRILDFRNGDEVKFEYA